MHWEQKVLDGRDAVGGYRSQGNDGPLETCGDSPGGVKLAGDHGSQEAL